MADGNYDNFDEDYFVEPDVVESDEQIPEDWFLQEKRDLLERIDKFEALIEQRRGLMEQNLERLIHQELVISAELHNATNADFMNKERLDGLVKALFDLESQKRAERVGGWGDMTALMKEVLALMADYKRLVRSGSF